MRKIKTVLAFVFALSFMLTSFPFVQLANAANSAQEQIVQEESKHWSECFDEKVYSDATMSDDFESDALLIVINKENSEVNKEFSKDDIATVVDARYTKNENGHRVLDSKNVSTDTKLEDVISVDATAKSKIVSISDLTEMDEAGALIDGDDAFRQILYVKLNTASKAEVLDTMSILESNPYFESVEPNIAFEQPRSVSTPNDTYYAIQDYLERIGVAPSEAWDITTGLNQIEVGIIDGGWDIQHEDLVDNMMYPHYFSSDGTNNVGVGSNDTGTQGTQIAGLIGASQNGIGVVGVCWSISMNPYRCANTAAALCSAISYARSKNVQILNYSGAQTTNLGNSFRVAIHNYPGLFITNAGNGHVNINSTTNAVYPAEYRLPNMIIVAGTYRSGNYEMLCSNSNYGSNKIDIAAPGSELYTTKKTDDYGDATGTEFAAALVTGTAALIKSKYPNMNAAQIKESIINGSTKYTTLTSYVSEGRFLNANDALVYASRYSFAVQTTPISDGLYYIRNVRSGLLLGVPNNGASGTRAAQLTETYADNQTWRVQLQADGNYTFIPNYNTSLKLRVENGSSNNNDWIIVQNAPALNVIPDAAKWKIVPNDNGSFQIQSYCSGYTKVIAVQNASTSSGAECLQYTFGSSKNDQWIFESATPLADGIYRLKNMSNIKYLSKNSSSSQSGTQCIVATWSNANYKKWQIKSTINGYYDIRPITDADLSLTAASGSVNANTIISGYSAFGTYKWKIVPLDSTYTTFKLMCSRGNYSYCLGIDGTLCVQKAYDTTGSTTDWAIEYLKPLINDGIEDGVYKIINKSTGYCINIPNNSTADGTQITQSTYTGATAQRWIVKYNWDSTYTIASKLCDYKGLTVSGTADNTSILLNPLRNDGGGGVYSTHWKISGNTSNGYTIASSVTDFASVIKPKNNSYSSGAWLVQYASTGATIESWSFIKL